VTPAETAHALGAVATLGMGGLGLVAPRACARLVGLKAVSGAGFAEFRATYGGLFLMLGLTPLVTGEAAAFLVSGLAWLGAAGGRVVSIVADRSRERANVIAVGVELAFAGLLLV
jgi:hypothetical protein